MNKPRHRLIEFALLASVLVLLTPFKLSLAHSPHHVITDIATAPTGNGNADVFILITDQLLRSDRSGAHWKNLVNGLNTQYGFTSVVVSPAYEFDHTAFVSTSGDGVYRTRDKGDSWQPVNAGLDRLDISAMSLVIDSAGRYSVLAASASGGAWQLGADDRWQIVLTEVVQVSGFSTPSISEQPSVVHGGDSTGRLWVSTDGGRLWEVSYDFERGKAVTSVASQGATVLVGIHDAGLYRSNDGGKTFSIVDSLQATRQRGCNGAEIVDPVRDSTITSITMSPPDADIQRVFLTTWYDGLFVSEDAGLNWSKWDDGLSCDVQADDMSEAHFRRFAIDSTEDGEPVYWLGAFDGLFRGVGASPSWQQLETLPLGLIKGMAVTKGREDVAIALATYGGGFYLTEDRGNRWTIGNKGLQTTRLTGLVFSPDYAEDGVIYAGASRRLLRSSDRGESWQRIDLRITSFGRSVRNKLRGWGIPTGWLGTDNLAQVYPTILAMSNDDAGRVRFATRFHGIMGYDHASGEVVSLWPETTRNINTFETSPSFSADHTLFASIRGEGLIRSEDGGNHWIAVNDGLDFVEQWKRDPAGGNLRRDVFIAISPDFADDELIIAGSPAGDGVFISRDRGDGWNRLNLDYGAASAPVLAITFSPDYAIDETIIVSIKGLGLLRSIDGGESFESIGKELAEDNASIELLAISPAYLTDQSVIAASDEQLFISEDGGNSWTTLLRPVRYEDMRDVVKFSGETRRQRSEDYSAMTETLITGEGSAAALRFVGRGVRILGSLGDHCTDANVYLDDRFAGKVECMADESAAMHTLFQIDALAFGAHDVVIRIESDAADGAVGIDAFDVLQTGSQ